MVAGLPRRSFKVPLPGIPLWNDQNIDLFHGTLDRHVASIMLGVDPAVCQYLRDFGRGFYTTTNRLQAERWARDLSRHTSGVPAVIKFTVERNALAGLDCLFFVRGTPPAAAYWSFVQYCRTIAADHNRAHTGWYDLVLGPVSGSLRKQTVMPDGDQVSFHTNAAASVLDNSQRVQVL